MAVLFTDLLGNPYKLEDLEGIINLKSYIYTVNQTAVDANTGNQDVIQFDPLRFNACDTNYFNRYFYKMNNEQSNSIGQLIDYFSCIDDPDNLKVVGSD